MFLNIASCFILGLMLFSMFISDLEVNIKSLLIQLADDTDIGGVVNDEDGADIQRNLNYLVNWAHSNKRCLNKAKCIHTSKNKEFRPFLQNGGLYYGKQ